MMTRSLVLPAMVAATMMALAPTSATAWLVGSGACRSYHEDVTTHYRSEIYKRCFPDCLTSVTPTHNTVKSSIIDWYEPGYKGPVRVAIISNDSRLGSGMIGEPKRLGTLPHPGGLTNWHVLFTGLKPEHYYAMIIYGSDDSKPFYRACLLSGDDPDPQSDTQ